MRLEYFQMIDTVAEFDPAARRLLARSTVPNESPVFEGHFPGHPLMPGVLLIETMAQTSGYLLLGLSGFKQMPFLAGVKEAKLRTFITPGTPMEVDAEVEHDGSGFAMTKATIRVEGKRVCDARLTFKTLPFPAAELGLAMRSQAEEIGMPIGELIK